MKFYEGSKVEEATAVSLIIASQVSYNCKENADKI